MNINVMVIGLVCLMVGLNILYAILNYKDRQNDREEKNKLIKALIANNAIEYAQTEKSPKEHLRELEIENDLAIKAEKLLDKQEGGARDIALPIT